MEYRTLILPICVVVLLTRWSTAAPTLITNPTYLSSVDNDISNNPQKQGKVKQDEGDDNTPVNALVSIRDGIFTQLLFQLLSPLTGEFQKVATGLTQGLLNATGLRVPAGPQYVQGTTRGPIYIGSVDSSGQFQLVQGVTSAPFLVPEETTPEIRFAYGGDGGAVGKLVGGLVKGIVTQGNPNGGATAQQQGGSPIIYVLPSSINGGSGGGLVNANTVAVSETTALPAIDDDSEEARLGLL